MSKDTPEISREYEKYAKNALEDAIYSGTITALHLLDKNIWTGQKAETILPRKSGDKIGWKSAHPLRLRAYPGKTTEINAIAEGAEITITDKPKNRPDKDGDHWWYPVEVSEGDLKYSHGEKKGWVSAEFIKINMEEPKPPTQAPANKPAERSPLPPVGEAVDTTSTTGTSHPPAGTPSDKEPRAIVTPPPPAGVAADTNPQRIGSSNPPSGEAAGGDAGSSGGTPPPPGEAVPPTTESGKRSTTPTGTSESTPDASKEPTEKEKAWTTEKRNIIGDLGGTKRIEGFLSKVTKLEEKPGVLLTELGKLPEGETKAKWINSIGFYKNQGGTVESFYNGLNAESLITAIVGEMNDGKLPDYLQDIPPSTIKSSSTLAGSPAPTPEQSKPKPNEDASQATSKATPENVGPTIAEKLGGLVASVKNSLWKEFSGETKELNPAEGEKEKQALINAVGGEQKMKEILANPNNEDLGNLIYKALLAQKNEDETARWVDWGGLHYPDRNGHNLTDIIPLLVKDIKIEAPKPNSITTSYNSKTNGFFSTVDVTPTNTPAVIISETRDITPINKDNYQGFEDIFKTLNLSNETINNLRKIINENDRNGVNNLKTTIGGLTIRLDEISFEGKNVKIKGLNLQDVSNITISENKVIIHPTNIGFIEFK